MENTDLVAKLRPIFDQGPEVKRGTEVLGRGLFEVDLVNLLGFEKRELKKYCHMGILMKTTTRYQGGWRNTYVLVESAKKEVTA